METSQITLIMTSVTAIAAIIGPVITSVVAAISAERIKRVELYTPRSLDSLAEMAKLYIHLSRYDESKKGSNLTVIDDTAYRKFSASCYSVIPLVSNQKLRRQITDLLSAISRNHRCTNDTIDGAFDMLMLDLAKAIKP